MTKEEAIQKMINDSAYQSPIEMIYHDMQMHFEDEVCKAVQQVDIHVDKEELVKALEYDRKQYEKGYSDARKIFEKPRGKWVWRKDENNLRTYDLLCSKCGHKIFTCENYDSIEEAQKTIDGIIEDGKPMPNYCMMCGSDNRKKMAEQFGWECDNNETD